MEVQHWILGWGEDAEDSYDVSNSTENYQRTNLLSWENIIGAQQIYQENQTQLRSFGSRPANAKALFTYSSVNGVVDSAKVLTDNGVPLSSIQMQIIKDSMSTLMDDQYRNELQSIQIAGLWEDTKAGIKNSVKKLDKGYNILKGLGGYYIDNGVEEITFLFKKSTYEAIYEFGDALYHGEISLADIKNGLKELMMEEYVDPYVYLKNNTKHVIFGDPTNDEAYDYGYQIGKGLNTAGEIALAIATGGAAAVAAISKLKALLKSLAKISKGTKDGDLIEAALKVSSIIKYGPMNPGPLPENIAKTFRSSTYTKIVTQEEITLYRAYGGKAGELGSYWTRTKPQGHYRQQLIVPWTKIGEIQQHKFLQSKFRKVQQYLRALRQNSGAWLVEVIKFLLRR